MNEPGKKNLLDELFVGSVVADDGTIMDLGVAPPKQQGAPDEEDDDDDDEEGDDLA